MYFNISGKRLELEFSINSQKEFRICAAVIKVKEKYFKEKILRTFKKIILFFKNVQKILI